MSAENSGHANRMSTIKMKIKLMKLRKVSIAEFVSGKLSKLVNIWQSYKQEDVVVSWLSRALSSTSSSVLAMCTTCARQPLSCL